MEEKVFDIIAQLHNEIKDMKVNMATKDDLKGMASKSDIANMATKDDLKGMASKSDIANMATKDDLKGMVSKSDIINMATKEDLKVMATKEDLKGVATKDDLKGMATKEDLKDMATKDDIRRLEGELFRFENRTENRLEALFDGYKQNTEAIYELRKDVNNLKSVVEQHEVKLKIVK